MKALTLTQPWASLVARGAKKIETRSWYTRHRGPLAIHAARSDRDEDWEICRVPVLRQTLIDAGILTRHDFPRGAVIATCYLSACLPTGPDQRPNETDRMYERRMAAFAGISEQERAFGDFSPGRYAWFLEDVIELEPQPWRGSLGLWDWLPLLSQEWQPSSYSGVEAKGRGNA